MSTGVCSCREFEITDLETLTEFPVEISSQSRKNAFGFSCLSIVGKIVTILGKLGFIFNENVGVCTRLSLDSNMIFSTTGFHFFKIFSAI